MSQQQAQAAGGGHVRRRNAREAVLRNVRTGTYLHLSPIEYRGERRNSTQTMTLERETKVPVNWLLTYVWDGAEWQHTGERREESDDERQERRVLCVW